MIGKLVRVFSALITSFCVATVIAAVILAAYYANAWRLDRQKLVEMLAVAQGVDVQSLKEQAQGERPASSSEQPSYEQMVEVRAVKARNLELREQSLRTGLDQFRLEQQKTVEERKRLEQIHEGLQGELLAMQKSATAGGRDEVRRTLETLKPKQAKELVVQMLEKKELDEVVTLLSAMPEAKRAKIIAEFKTPAELEQVGEVLRRIRLGIPTSTMADNAQKQMEPPKGPGS